MAGGMFRVYYEHKSSTGGVTTGFKDIPADSAAEAKRIFKQTHNSPPGSYKPVKVERI